MYSKETQLVPRMKISVLCSQRVGSLGKIVSAPSPEASPPPGHGRGRSAPHKALYSSSFKEGEKQIPLETCFHGNQLAIDNVAAVGPPEGEKIFNEIRPLRGPRRDSSYPDLLRRSQQSPSCPFMGKSPGQFPKKVTQKGRRASRNQAGPSPGNGRGSCVRRKNMEAKRTPPLESG